MASPHERETQWRIVDLRSLGLTPYEAKAYLAPVRQPALTATEVAKSSSVPQPRIHDVLASLTDRRLVSSQPGETVHYAAADPLQAGFQPHPERGKQEDSATAADQGGVQLPRSHGVAGLLHIDRSPASEPPWTALWAGTRQQLRILARYPKAITYPADVDTLIRLLAGGGLRAVYEYAALTGRLNQAATS